MKEPVLSLFRIFVPLWSKKNMLGILPISGKLPLWRAISYLMAPFYVLESDKPQRRNVRKDLYRKVYVVSAKL